MVSCDTKCVVLSFSVVIWCFPSKRSFVSIESSTPTLQPQIKRTPRGKTRKTGADQTGVLSHEMFAMIRVAPCEDESLFFSLPAQMRLVKANRLEN